MYLLNVVDILFYLTIDKFLRLKPIFNISLRLFRIRK
jgi:hypothetical protein